MHPAIHTSSQGDRPADPPSTSAIQATFVSRSDAPAWRPWKLIGLLKLSWPEAEAQGTLQTPWNVLQKLQRQVPQCQQLKPKFPQNAKNHQIDPNKTCPEATQLPRSLDPVLKNKGDKVKC